MFIYDGDWVVIRLTSRCDRAGATCARRCDDDRDDDLFLFEPLAISTYQNLQRIQNDDAEMICTHVRRSREETLLLSRQNSNQDKKLGRKDGLCYTSALLVHASLTERGNHDERPYNGTGVGLHIGQ